MAYRLEPAAALAQEEVSVASVFRERRLPLAWASPVAPLVPAAHTVVVVTLAASLQAACRLALAAYMLEWLVMMQAELQLV